MKFSRIFRLCALLGALSLSAGAAAQSLPKKDLLVMELFARTRVVPRAYSEALRAQVGAAFEQRGRFRMVDAQMSADAMNAGDLINPLHAPAELNDYLIFRTPDMEHIGARYAINGAVTDYKFEHVLIPNGDNPPIKGFKSTFMLMIMGRDYLLGQTIDPCVLELTATAPIAEDADHGAIASLAGKLTYYIDRNFRFETTILELCPPEGRKQVIKELYIHSGVEMGVTAGDTFNVYEELIIAGVPTRELVGRLRVNNVHDQGIARCKITKGDDQIIRAFGRGNALICVSDTKALFY